MLSQRGARRVQLRRHRRRLAGAARRAGARRAGGADDVDGAAARRDRHRQGAGRARHPHQQRARARPFVRVNCAALRRACSRASCSATRRARSPARWRAGSGRFELADGGTLFLDEIGELPPDVQAKLLRVLQEREFERVGGTETIKVDVRVIAATNRDLEQQIADGHVPRGPLLPAQRRPDRRCRRCASAPSDIPLLAEHFLQKYAPARRQGGARPRRRRAGARCRLPLAGQRARAGERHRARADPGARHRAHRGRSRVHAPARRRAAPARPPPAATAGRAGGRRRPRPLHERLHEQERAAIVAAIDRAQGNIAHAARALGINRSTLYYRLRKHGLEHLLADEGVADGRDRLAAAIRAARRAARRHNRTMKLLFVMDPLARLQIAGDTTFAIMLAAQARGHEIWFCEPRHLSLEHADAGRARLAGDRPPRRGRSLPARAAGHGAARRSCDAVFMRKDPPFDLDYYFATLLLERARGQTLIINDPRGLREQNEKLAVLELPRALPADDRDARGDAPALVPGRAGRRDGGQAARRLGRLRRVPRAQGRPEHRRDPRAGDQPRPPLDHGAEVPARGPRRRQAHPAVDGEPLCAVLRVPAPDDARGNLHVGAKPMADQARRARPEHRARARPARCASAATSSSAWT